MTLRDELEIEAFDEEEYEQYKRIRNFVSKIKEKCNFKCVMCENTCCTSNLASLIIYDYQYMLENNADTSGLNLHVYERTGKVIGISMKGKYSELRKDYVGHQCYYYEENKCSLHPYNPLMCHCFPFNYQFEDDFYYKSKRPSTRRMWIQLFSTRKSKGVCDAFNRNRLKYRLLFFRYGLLVGSRKSKRDKEIKKIIRKQKRNERK